MKAAVCRAFGQPLVIEDIAIAPPGPGEVAIDVKACAICHSDIFYAEGAWGGDLPAVYGHEAAGIVTAVGDGVTRAKPGDHVIATLIRSCGHCHYCDTGSLVMCEEVFPLDEKSPITAQDETPLTQPMRIGAFAEQVVVHESQMVTIAKDVPFESASVVACAVLTGYGAVVNTAKVKPGQSVVIIGCGGVGLNTVQGAAVAGAGPIIAIDLSDTKLKAAQAFGATHAAHPGRDDVAGMVQSLTDGRGADFVFVTVGAKAAFDQALGLIGKNGTVVIVGMPPAGVFAEYDPGTMAAWNQTIIGSKMGEADIARDIPTIMEHYRAGRLKLDELVTGRYALTDINEAIAGVNAGDALRNVIVFD